MPIVDYLLLTPLDEEWRAVRSIVCAAPAVMREVATDPFTYYVWRHISPEGVDSREYLIAAASVGQVGSSNASIIATSSSATWLPRQIVLLGIAGSFDKKEIRLGDVVVPSEIVGYEVSSTTGRQPRHSFRRTVHMADELPIDRVRSVRNDPEVYKRWQEECGCAAHTLELDLKGRPPVIHSAVVGSGNSVVKSVAFARELRRQLDSRIAVVEMEGKGLFQAVHRLGGRSATSMIRGISDYADSNKSALERESKDAWRAFAAGNAGRLLRLLWDRANVIPVSASYRMNLDRGPLAAFHREARELVLTRERAQHLYFPALLDRVDPNPRMWLDVTGYAGEQPASDMRGKMIAHRGNERIIVSGEPTKAGALRFVIQASEIGVRATLFLSVPNPAPRFKFHCEDDFGRTCESTLNLTK